MTSQRTNKTNAEGATFYGRSCPVSWARWGWRDLATSGGPWIDYGLDKQLLKIFLGATGGLKHGLAIKWYQRILITFLCAIPLFWLCLRMFPFKKYFRMEYNNAKNLLYYFLTLKYFKVNKNTIGHGLVTLGFFSSPAVPCEYSHRCLDPRDPGGGE